MTSESIDNWPDLAAGVHEYVVQADRVAVRVAARSAIKAREVLIFNFFTVRKRRDLGR